MNNLLFFFKKRKSVSSVFVQNRNRVFKAETTHLFLNVKLMLQIQTPIYFQHPTMSQMSKK